MFKIIGGDGKEYGPVTLDQLRDWSAQGRIDSQTRIKAENAAEWQPAAKVPELAPLFAPAKARPIPKAAPPVIAPLRPAPEKRLAVISLVLGLCSFVLCLSALTGLPAIIVGHLARRRAIRLPQRYGGSGLAAAGLVLGYASLLLSLVIAAMLLPALAKAKHTQRPSDCQRNLREIGLAFKVWALDHNDQYPFNVSTNNGGTRELCDIDQDGFDRHAITHFLVISNELSTPAFLVCPNDRRTHSALSFSDLGELNVTYRLRTGTNVNPANPQEVLAVCPIHGNQLYCDGNVRAVRRLGR